MERDDTSHTRIETVISLDCSDGTRHSLVTARLGYSIEDPFAVTITFLDRPGAGQERGVTWTVARDLLRGGMTAPTGEGDVQMWPGTDQCRRATLVMEFDPGTGAFVANAYLRDVHAFLGRTYAEVPAGTEHLHLDLDALIGQLVQPLS